MPKNIQSLLVLITLLGTFLYPSFIARAEDREILEQKIKEHSTQLEAVNKQVEAARAALGEVQQQKTSLQKELKNIDYSINQLTLNIKSDEISSQKLSYEIESLSYDLDDIDHSIEDKRTAVIEFLRKLQQTDTESTILMFLKHDTLAEGLTEAQSLDAIRTQLTLDIGSLKNLQQEYSEKLGMVSEKKGEVDVRAKNLKNRKSIVEEQKQERQVILTQTKNQETVYQKQLEELKKQQNVISDAIQKIEDQLRASFDPSLLPAKRPGVFLWPMQLVSDGGKGRVTQHYGERSSLYRGKPHNGLDVGAPVGTPIFAADDGVVMRVDNNDKSTWSKYQYGKYVMIKHNNNLATIYAHLSRQVVSAGTEVQRGDIIGYSGNTGYATGPHLHFGVYWAPSVVFKSIPPAAGLVPIGVTVVPEDYL